MAFRHFPGQSQATLETALAAVIAEELSGKTVTDVGAGDTSSRKSVQVSINERKRRILHDLCVLDPVTYPPADVLPITRTRARFGPLPDNLSNY